MDSLKKVDAFASTFFYARSPQPQCAGKKSNPASFFTQPLPPSQRGQNHRQSAFPVGKKSPHPDLTDDIFRLNSIA
jgi:hypothetical protein